MKRIRLGQWLLMFLSPALVLLGLRLAQVSFDRAMDEDIDNLSARLEKDGPDGRQAEAIVAAFRSVRYNVSNLVSATAQILAMTLFVLGAALLLRKDDNGRSVGSQAAEATNQLRNQRALQNAPETGT